MHRHARFVGLGILFASFGPPGCQTGDPLGPDLRQQQAAAVSSPSFVEFESGQVRPIAMSPDGAHLFAVNTPNGTLEIFTSRRTGSQRLPAFRWGSSRWRSPPAATTRSGW